MIVETSELRHQELPAGRVHWLSLLAVSCLAVFAANVFLKFLLLHSTLLQRHHKSSLVQWVWRKRKRRRKFHLSGPIELQKYSDHRNADAAVVLSDHPPRGNFQEPIDDAAAFEKTKPGSDNTADAIHTASAPGSITGRSNNQSLLLLLFCRLLPRKALSLVHLFWRLTEEGLEALVLTLAVTLHALHCFSMKMRLAVYSATLFVFSDESFVQEPPSSSLCAPDDLMAWPIVDKKSVLFVRHGESVWNWCVNKAGLWKSIGRAIVCGLVELGMAFEAQTFLWDSPLSATGVVQSRALLKFLTQHMKSHCLETERSAAAVDEESSKEPLPPEVSSSAEGVTLEASSVGRVAFVCSNLRRAVETMRLAIPFPAVELHVLSALQEATRNPDGVPLGALAFEAVERTISPPTIPTTTTPMTTMCVGAPLQRRPIRGGRLNTRLNDFVDWCFSRPEETIVACGHSLWLRYFFRTFLSQDHPIKKRKLANCAVVQFVIEKRKADGDCSQVQYQLNGASVKVIYGDLV